MNNQPAILIKNVSKSYKLYKASKDRLKEALHPLGKQYHTDFYAIREFNLEIKKGEILGIVGQNGCGKSTLLKLISKVLKPSSGEINVNGKVTALLELGAGFNPEFTGRENIRFYSTILGLSNQESESLTPAVIEFAEIGEFIDQPLKTYSSGMKSRLGFAVAIHVDPDILILDEVLAVGDALFKRKCYAKMEEFFKSGKTIIYVSHDINSVNQLCTRAIFMESGILIADGIPNDITKRYQQFIYAAPDKKADVLKEISLSFDACSSDSFKDYKALVEVRPDSGNNQTHKNKPENNEYPESYLLTDLKPESTVEYKNASIEIIEPRIYTLDGRNVNVLVFGERYNYSVKYKSSANQEYTELAYGLDINDSRGVKISAIESVLSHKRHLKTRRLSPGEMIELVFEFDCRFPAGLYFINSGVSSFSNGEQKVLNRKVDILCFQVLDSPGRIYGGAYVGIMNVSIRTGEQEQKYPVI